jgi:hypothetical protein
MTKYAEVAHMWRGMRSLCGQTLPPGSKIIRTPKGYQPFCTVCKPPSSPRGRR